MKKGGYLGVIPARGGSKRIYNKNTKMIAGKPLLAWTIEAAKMSKLLDKVIVSTEDIQIANIAGKYGAEVLARPSLLAEDTTKTLEVLQHVLLHYNVDNIVLLQPTSPIRDKGLIDKCIDLYDNSEADYLATGYISKEFVCGDPNPERSQDMSGTFCLNGNVFIMQADQVKAGKAVGSNIKTVELDEEQSCDIDTPFDFWLAEQVLLKRMKGGNF